MAKETIPLCPLCQGSNSQFFHQDKFREYLRCTHCALAYVPPAFHLSASQEKAEYDLHQNDPTDPGYRKFLSRLYQPLQERLADDAHGLDFGCGPGPTLSLMFMETGYRMEIYDPFYADQPEVLNRRYNFITATEVVEHLRQPGFELDRLYNMLAGNGILGIMTKLVTSQAAFANWHYKNDRSHICFFSVETFGWLANRWQAELKILGRDVILLQKNC